MAKKTMLLEDIAKFYAGLNVSRIAVADGVPENWAYSIDDFDNDFSCLPSDRKETSFVGNDEKLRIDEDDCIISLAKSKATIVGKASIGKCITVNFVKCDIDKTKIDPWYFCFMFNENKVIQKQLNMSLQGTISCIKRISLASLKTVSLSEIEIPDITQQKIIGQLYYNTLKCETLEKLQAEQKRKFIMEKLKKL